jgi:hypothetical protein
MLRSLYLGFDQLAAWMIGQPQVQLPEDLGLVVGGGAVLG